MENPTLTRFPSATESEPEALCSDHLSEYGPPLAHFGGGLMRLEAPSPEKQDDQSQGAKTIKASPMNKGICFSFKRNIYIYIYIYLSAPLFEMQCCH